jgi:hypothetical protein
MSRDERATVAHLGTVLSEAAMYPSAFAGQAAEAADELLRLCRAKRGWLVRTNPRTVLIEAVRDDAAEIQSSRPDLAEVLRRC